VALRRSQPISGRTLDVTRLDVLPLGRRLPKVAASEVIMRIAAWLVCSILLVGCSLDSDPDENVEQAPAVVVQQEGIRPADTSDGGKKPYPLTYKFSPEILKY
jgi:hypothetical protein